MEESLSEWIKFSLFSDMTNNSYLLLLSKNIKSYKSLNFIIIYLNRLCYTKYTIKKWNTNMVKQSRVVEYLHNC